MDKVHYLQFPQFHDKYGKVYARGGGYSYISDAQ